jgi:glutathione peroxidase
VLPPGSDPEIGVFCRSNHGVEFPMFSKVHVTGPDTHPVYVYLTSLREPIGGVVQWNFEKYLVDRNRKVVARYPSRVSPRDARLVGEVERLLAEPRPEPPTAGLAR